MQSHATVYGENLLLPTPGMEEMAGNVFERLQKQSEQNGHANTFEMCKMKLTPFPSGEYEPELLESVRGATVFLLHPMQLPNPNVGLVNLLLIIDALMRADIGRIKLVLPFIPFQRNDRRKDNARVSISAKVVANLIERYAAVRHIITLDLHTDQEVGLYNIPVDNIGATVIFLDDVRRRFNNDLSNLVVVSPDVGSANRVRRVARKLNAPLAIIDKDRKGPGQAEVLGILGMSVKGKDAILFDDMIDTGGTIINAARKLREEGARSVEMYAIHGLFSGQALERFKDAGFPVRVTASIPRTEEFREAHASWLTYVSIDQLLAKAIYAATVMRESISELSK
ncbi:MAG: ribose-phosphate diphosphokinase [bacterium]|nr:ribose-phosphate diphosphokinase [bacterium]